MNSRGNLILLIRSDAWTTAIRRQSWPLRIGWAVSIDDALSEAAQAPGSIAVIEFSGRESAGQFEELAILTNNPYHLGILAVGDHSLPPWRRLLISLGFTDAFWSTTQVDRLGQLACRHAGNTIAAPESLEQRIDAELPWKPVATRRQET